MPQRHGCFSSFVWRQRDEWRAPPVQAPVASSGQSSTIPPAKFAEAWEQAILETSLRCGHLQDSAFSTTKELLRAKGWRIWLKKEPWNPGWEWVTVSEFKLKYRAWRTAIHRRVDLDLAGSNSDASSSSD